MTKKPRKPMSRYTRLGIVLTIFCIIILIAPNLIRYVMNMQAARNEIRQEKKYIATAAAEVHTPEQQLPVMEHWDLSTQGKMKLVFSNKVLEDKDADLYSWIKSAAKIWNDALGEEVIEVTDQVFNQSTNTDLNIWPADVDFQIMVGVKSYSNDEILASTTIGGNMMWVSTHALDVWRSDKIEPEDYKSGAVIGPLGIKKIKQIHAQEAIHTLTHEFGHAFGLKHQGTASDLMSPMVGINDANKPSKIEIDSVQAVRYIAMNPNVLNYMTFVNAFDTEYRQYSGGVNVPANYVVINDEITN